MSPAERDALLSWLIGERWPFSPLLNAFRPATDSRVLDIGGGEGGLLRELEILGHIGRRELIGPLHGTDAHALPFQGATFDAVFLLRVLGHLHSPALALAEAGRVLSPGGRLTVAAHGPEHLAGLLKSGSVGALPFALPEMRVQAFEVCRSVTLGVQHQQQLATSYGLEHRATGALHSQLQLTGWWLFN